MYEFVRYYIICFLKVGCDKRFKIERNQEPPHDWDPPAKIPKPPTNSRGVAGVSLLAQGRHHQNLAAVRGALTQFNQQGGRGPYSAMPALQFGPGRGRPPSFNKPFIPNVTRNIQPRTILPAFGQAARLAGNPSVTIQVCSNTFFFVFEPKIIVSEIFYLCPIQSGYLKHP